MISEISELRVMLKLCDRRALFSYVVLALLTVPLCDDAKAWEVQRRFTADGPLIDGEKSIVEMKSGWSRPMTDVVPLYYRFSSERKVQTSEKALADALRLLDASPPPAVLKLTTRGGRPTRWLALQYRIFMISVTPAVLALVPHEFHIGANADPPYQLMDEYERQLIPGSGRGSPLYHYQWLYDDTHYKAGKPLYSNFLEFTSVVPAIDGIVLLSDLWKEPIALEVALADPKLGLTTSKVLGDGLSSIRFERRK